MSANEQQSPAGHSGRSTRRKGRELALQALYQIEITGDPSVGAVELFLRHFEGTAKAKEFARRLVSGVVSQRPAIDQAIEQSTENWKLARLAKVDLVILRMATYELVFCPDIPSTVSLDEAIEIGKRFGSADSATFINGVLDQIAQSAKSA
ncbi:MAG TPA: transcription antitermination factor NusB [Candidatus Binatia bacterium]|nr:transcription antitermination factor NusB [Candidatus Binatia bacterium]